MVWGYLCSSVFIGGWQGVAERERGKPRGADTAPDRLEESRVPRRSEDRRGDGARLRHLPRLPALREPLQRVPDALRRGGCDGHGRGVGGPEAEVLGCRRAVLPLRPLLHGEMSLRPAPPVERG